jgi:hypothetical protein
VKIFHNDELKITNMEMIDKINELKEAYVNAKTDKERDAINDEITKLSASHGDEFAYAMIASAKQTAEKAEALSLKMKLKEVSPFISMSYVAKEYFGKSRAWIHQRINGLLVNGKPATFTSAELETLKRALNDISNKAKEASCSL